MIHPATQEISNYFTMREIKHRIDEAGECRPLLAAAKQNECKANSEEWNRAFHS